MNLNMIQHRIDVSFIKEVKSFDMKIEGYGVSYIWFLRQFM